MTETTKRWFGFEGKIPAVFQGLIYGLMLMIGTPWLGEFVIHYWDWVHHVWN